MPQWLAENAGILQALSGIATTVLSLGALFYARRQAVAAQDQVQLARAADRRAATAERTSAMALLIAEQHRVDSLAEMLKADDLVQRMRSGTADWSVLDGAPNGDLLRAGGVLGRDTSTAMQVFLRLSRDIAADARHVQGLVDGTRGPAGAGIDVLSPAHREASTLLDQLRTAVDELGRLAGDLVTIALGGRSAEPSRLGDYSLESKMLRQLARDNSGTAPMASSHGGDLHL